MCIHRHPGEMVLKLFALGAVEYWAEPFNRFDGVVVVMSLLDIVSSQLKVDIGVNTSVLRAFRLLRVFKLARSWVGLRSVLQVEQAPPQT